MRRRVTSYEDRLPGLFGLRENYYGGLFLGTVPALLEASRPDVGREAEPMASPEQLLVPSDPRPVD